MIATFYVLGTIATLVFLVWLNVAARRRPPLTPDEEHEARQW